MTKLSAHVNIYLFNKNHFFLFQLFVSHAYPTPPTFFFLIESAQAPTQQQGTDSRETTLNEALQHEDYFGVKEMANLKDLFNVGCIAVIH